MTTVLEQVSPAARFAAIDDFAPMQTVGRGGRRPCGGGITIAKSGILNLPVLFLRAPAVVTVDYSAKTHTIRIRPASPTDQPQLKVNERANSSSLKGTMRPLGLAGKRLRWHTSYVVDGALYLPLDEAEVTG